MPVLGGKNGHGLLRTRARVVGASGMRRPAWTSSPSLEAAKDVREDAEGQLAQRGESSRARTEELGTF